MTEHVSPEVPGSMPPPPVPPATELPTDEPRVISTSGDATDGLSKCINCGATDIALNVATSQLRCNFCRHEWSTANANEAYGLHDGVGELTGITMGSGSADVIPSAEIVMTF